MPESVEPTPGDALGDAKVLFRSYSFRVYAGPEYWAGLGTLFFVVAISALFNIFTAPYFIDDGVLAALIVIWILTLICIGSNYRLVFTDPGIVPKHVFYKDQYDPIKKRYREKAPAMAVESGIRTFPVRSKFCEACNDYRAPRVTHCSSCDTCMERFDHHCPWLGTCVAKRNYSTFLIFMFSLSIVTLGTLGVSMAHLALYTLDVYNSDSDSGLGRAIRIGLADNIPVAIVCGFCVVFMWFIVGLTGYHCYLSFHAMTTYEHIRGAFESLGNPFDRGAWWKNFLWIFQEPVRPSWIDLKTRTANFGMQVESKLDRQ
jgi:hypothetical protein